MWVCLGVVFRQGMGFPGLARGMRRSSSVGEVGGPPALLCLPQYPAEKILTSTSMKPFAYELHKFPDISSWSSPKNDWKKARCLGCLALFRRRKGPLLQRLLRAGGRVLVGKCVLGPSSTQGQGSSPNPLQLGPCAPPAAHQRAQAGGRLLESQLTSSPYQPCGLWQSVTLSVLHCFHQ